MAEYIEREALLKELRKSRESHAETSKDFCLLIRCENIVREQLAADVKPVRHGQWIEAASYGRYECSECHGADTDCCDYYGTHDVKSQEWCPLCGAKMDGGKNHA